jgi:hypothetical protein
MHLAAGSPPVVVNQSTKVRTSLYKIGIGVLKFRTKLFTVGKEMKFSSDQKTQQT